MGNKDYINEEIIMCFPTPVIKKDNNGCKYTFKNGDLVHFKNGSKIETKTNYYQYSSNLLILDYDREIPIAHIIINDRIRNTLPVAELNKGIFNKVDQVIDIEGNELKVYSLNDIYNLIEALSVRKCEVESIYKNSKQMLAETIKLSNRMRQVDEAMGSNRILDFIDTSNFNKVMIGISSVFRTQGNNLEEFKNEVLAKNNLRIYLAISDIIEKETFIQFKYAQLEHLDLKNEAKELSKDIYDKFSETWIKKDDYKLEKQLGCYIECLNEMYWNYEYNENDINDLKETIQLFLTQHKELKENYLEWLQGSEEDKDDIRQLITEIIGNKDRKNLIFR